MSPAGGGGLAYYTIAYVVIAFGAAALQGVSEVATAEAPRVVVSV